MVEHKIITFHKQDVIEALEDYYLKTKGEKIDINFDAKALEYSSIREIMVKVISMNTEGVKAELDSNPISLVEGSFTTSIPYNASAGFTGYVTTNTLTDISTKTI